MYRVRKPVVIFSVKSPSQKRENRERIKRGREDAGGNSSLLNRTRPFGRWPSLTDPAGIPPHAEGLQVTKLLPFRRIHSVPFRKSCPLPQRVLIDVTVINSRARLSARCRCLRGFRNAITRARARAIAVTQFLHRDAKIRRYSFRHDGL